MNRKLYIKFLWELYQRMGFKQSHNRSTFAANKAVIGYECNVVSSVSDEDRQDLQEY